MQSEKLKYRFQHGLRANIANSFACNVTVVHNFKDLRGSVPKILRTTLLPRILPQTLTNWTIWHTWHWKRGVDFCLFNREKVH